MLGFCRPLRDLHGARHGNRTRMTRLEGGCVALTSAVQGAGEYPRLWVGLDFSASQDAEIIPRKSCLPEREE